MADELAGGAPAPAEAPAVAETPAPAPAAPAEIGSTERAEPERSPRSAIDRAFAKVDGGGEPEQPDRPRNPDGTFAAKDPATAPQSPVAAKEAPKATETAQKPPAPLSEAPTRFSADAKAAWGGIPDSVKGEVHRALREAEQGIEKYRATATRYEQVWKPFEDMAAASKLDAAKTLQGYVQIDQLLAQDFDKGITSIFQRKGIDPRAWAAKVAGQEPQSPDAKDQIIADLKQELATIKQDVGQIKGSVERNRQAYVGNALSQFMGSLSEGDQQLFEQLDSEIAAEIQADPSITLDTAFSRARGKAQERYQRLFPATQPAAAQTRTAPPAQTGKGTLQVTGAPGAGSDPVTRKPAPSARAALDGAFAQVGL